MPRPRFERLPSEQQRVILDRALEEFTAHGPTGASLNRIIEAAGISKGSMYYYFDDKDDLYAEVIRRQLADLVADAGPIGIPSDASPDAFWGELESLYLRLMGLLEQRPATAALMRGWLAGGSGPTPQQTQEEATATLGPWLAEAVAAGQRAGAVRTDLPLSLLVAIAVGLGQAMDVWLVTQPPADLEGAIATLIGTLRSALEPPDRPRADGSSPRGRV